MGEYLINAQGEDVVAGVRTPSPISHLKDQMPEVYDQFVEIATRLENYFRDMQDMEFTIEDGHLYMLQTRNGKRTAQAALQIACDLVDEGMITEQEAVLRVEPKQLDTLPVSYTHLHQPHGHHLCLERCPEKARRAGQPARAGPVWRGAGGRQPADPQ